MQPLNNPRTIEVLSHNSVSMDVIKTTNPYISRPEILDRTEVDCIVKGICFMMETPSIDCHEYMPDCIRKFFGHFFMIECFVARLIALICNIEESRKPSPCIAARTPTNAFSISLEECERHMCSQFSSTRGDDHHLGRLF